MKTSLITLVAFFSWMALYAQPFNVEVASSGQQPLLLGKINKEALLKAPYQNWFQTNYDAYTPDPEVIKEFRGALNEYTITLFMGTWCGDSKRQVPKFYKVLEAAEFPLERLTTIAVDRDSDAYKQSPGGEQEGRGVHRVPTMIFYKKGKEINRITESPKETFEKDMVNILWYEYTPNYHGVTLLRNALIEMDEEAFHQNRDQIRDQSKAFIESWKELNTYSFWLNSLGHGEKAATVAEINTELFPDEAGTYARLGRQLELLEKKGEAIVQYRKALALDPDNGKVKQLLSGLLEDNSMEGEK